MTRFYFHMRDGTDELLDPDGIRCQDMEGVRRSALEAALDVMGGDLRKGIVDLRYRIDVEDQSGEVVHTLPFGQAVRIVDHERAVAVGPKLIC